MKVKEESEATWLNLNIQKNKIWHLVKSLHGIQMGKQWKEWQSLLSCTPKSLQMVTAAMKLKDTSWKKRYDQSRQHIKKQRHYFINKCPSSQGYGFSSSHVWMWELDNEERWPLKNWCFWTVMLEKTPESPLDCKEIKPIKPEGY